MGFDNECILNIQSLAGEYFCPVCRLLVYPNEALQSQCTHLYCKPCLTYVVSTTRACPYDGYLVTEADSKPLSESNKSLAETIGKIAVHCLFHRSGCTWKGSLSDCTSHCSGCAFGNSPVVCNRCGTQIAHRQVQEHALTCPGVQPQAQQAWGASASATSTAATGDQTQSATQAAVVTSQTQPSQTAAAVPGNDLTKQSISSSQAQPVVQAAVPTPEQWYLQQQQYQQFYQPYPGYDPYQQQYQQHYPYQLQPQVYLQPQPQSQPLASHNQAAVATQPQNQTQINPQQQVPSVVPPQSQIQTQAHPSTPGQPTPQPYSQPQVPPQSHPQPVQMPQYQQPNSQMQHPQPQIQQQSQSQAQSQPHIPTSQMQMPQYQQPNSQMQHPQPQIQQQSQSQAQSQPHIPTSQPHSLSQPNQPPNSNFQYQTQHPSAHAVTGHHSFPQFNNDPQMQIGGLQQYPVHAEPQVVPTQSQNPIQMQIQLPKQAPLMRPPHSGTTTPSQQQPALLPSPGQVQIIPPAQQQQPPAQQPYFQQPGQPMQQRPIMQPVQQTFLQQHYLQQLPMAPQLHPTGQSHLFPPQTHAYLQQPMQHAKPPNIVGRPPMLNQGVQAQPYSQYGGSIIRPSYPGTNQQATNQNMLKANNQKSETGLNSTDLEHKSAEDIGDQSSEKVQPIIKEDGVGSTLKDLNNGKSVEVVAEDTKGVLKIAPEKMNNFIVENKDVDNSLQKMSPAKAVERPEEQGGNLVKEAVSGSDGVSKGIPAASTQIPGNPAPGGEVKLKYPHGVVFPHPNQVQAHQLPGPPPLLQAPPPGPSHPTQGPGAPQTHFRPQIPGHPLHPQDGIPGSALPFERGPSQHGPGRQSSELQSVAPQRPFIPGPSAAFSLSQGEATRAQSSVVLPPRAFDSHGGTMAGATPHGPEMFPNQRPNFMDSKGLDPHFPGSLEYGALSQPSGIHPNMTRMNGSRFFDSPSAVGSRDERFNPFPAGSKHRPEFEDDLKQFSRPFDRGPHGMKYNGGLKMDSVVGSVSSKFLSPYSGGGADDAGERLGGRHEDSFGRMDPTRDHLDFFGPGPGYGWHHMDNWASRSPGRELPGIFSRGFGGPGPDDIHGRGFGRFGEPFGGAFHESRFSMLPRHLHRGEFEGPHNMGMGDQLRNDLIEQDGFSGPLRWREHMGGPHGYSHLVEPVGFDTHPRYSRIREMGGPGSFDSFDRGDGPSFPRLGEPGFRSRFSPHGFPTDNGIFTGDLAFDKSRKRKPPVMGWCRICKVDCETVEGLDLHSQTKEHQKMAMEIVVTIKKNAKKQKLTSGDQSSPGDASQPRTVGTEDHGKNN